MDIYLQWKVTIVQQSAKRRPTTRANPAVDADHSCEEEDNELIPVYWYRQPPNAQVPAVHESPVSPDLPMSNEQDTQHTEPPDLCPVESSVDAQNVDCTPEIGKPPDMTDGTQDCPLTLNKPTSHQGDTEYLPFRRVILTEQTHGTDQIESDLPDTECPVENRNLPGSERPGEKENLPDSVDDIQDGQLPVLSDMSESEEEKGGNELDGTETEVKGETERRTEQIPPSGDRRGIVNRQGDLTMLNLEPP